VAELEIADQEFTLKHYLDRSKRPWLPLALGFLQGRDEEGNLVPGPLKELMRRGRETALGQYLFFHAIASGEQEGGFDVRLPASTWARANGGYFDPKTGRVDDAALHAVSRSWKLLRELELVKTERAGGRVKVFLLADDGSGDPYKHVGADKKGKKLDGPGYFKLPYEYWYEGWHKKLSLAGKAMLLVALYQGDGFPLSYEQTPRYYGISSATAQRGLRELVDAGLLHREQHRRPEPESPYGFADVYYYELLPPFGPRGWAAKWSHSAWRGPEVADKKKSAKAKKGKATGARKRKPRKGKGA
jgi:hypothetical protein